MSAIKLWCWNACPYAQRAWIALLTAGVEFEYNEINPYENRENQKWRRISPEGFVDFSLFLGYFSVVKFL